MICLEQITKRYGTGLPTLQGHSLHLHEGQFTCLQGPRGCCKTTLLNLIAGFIIPDNYLQFFVIYAFCGG